MRDMTRDECLAFIIQGARTGHLATVRPDGRPHIVPIWFIADGDEIIFTCWYDTVKFRNLTADPRIAISVDDPRPPHAFVMIEGKASMDIGTAEARIDIATRIAARYMGTERAVEYGKRYAVEGEYIVRVPISRMVGREGIVA